MEKFNFGGVDKKIARQIESRDSTIAKRIEGEPHFKKVFVEMGAGSRSIPVLTGRKFQPDELYIGMDADEETLQRGKELLENAGGIDQNIFFVAGEAEKLPLKNNSIESIHFTNLVSSRRPGPMSIESYVPRSEEELRRFISEAGRVLLPNGQIVIFETYSPDRGGEFDEISGLLPQQGFEVERVVNARDKDFKDIFKEYLGIYPNKETLPHDAYVLFARKKTKAEGQEKGK